MTTQAERDPIPAVATEPPAVAARGREPRRLQLWPVIGATLVAVGIAAGLLGRAWWLTHVTFDSDQAVVGLMAREILHGHFTAFFWGQVYGGVEPFVVAAVFGVA